MRWNYWQCYISIYIACLGRKHRKKYLFLTIILDFKSVFFYNYISIGISSQNSFGLGKCLNKLQSISWVSLCNTKMWEHRSKIRQMCDEQVHNKFQENKNAKSKKKELAEKKYRRQKRDALRSNTEKKNIYCRLLTSFSSSYFVNKVSVMFSIVIMLAFKTLFNNLFFIVFLLLLVLDSHSSFAHLVRADVDFFFLYSTECLLVNSII